MLFCCYKTRRSNPIGSILWDVFVDNWAVPTRTSSIGLMLIAANARWDDRGKFDAIVDLYLSFFDDEKPVTVRQCIQSLSKIVPYKQDCLLKITDRLLSIDLEQRKVTQRKLLLLDILSVLAAIQKVQPDERIERFISQAMTGGLLDPKSKRQVEVWINASAG